MLKRLLLTLIIAGITLTGYAQQDFTLKQCIDYGLQNHGSVTINKNEKIKAQQRSMEAISSYLPQINGSVSLDDNLKLQTTAFTTIENGVPMDVEIRMGKKYNTTASVQADQTIYDQSLTLAIKASRANTQLTEIGSQQNEEDLIYSISTAYYQVLVLDQNLKLMEVNRNKYENLLKILKLQFEKGVVKKVDFDRMRVALNNVNSQISVAQTNLDLAKNRLKNAIGLPLTETVNLTDTTLLQAYKEEVSDVEFDVENRLDYLRQKTMIQLYGLQSKQVMSTGFPRLSAYARFGATAFGDDLQKSFDKWREFSSIGLKLSVPIFSGLKRTSQYKSAHLDEKNERERLKLNENLFALQFENSKSVLNKSQLSLKNEELNVELAKEVFDNTTLQYSQGVASLSDLLNAETAYKEAEVNYINSLLSYYMAKLDVEKSNGTLKNYYNQL